MDKVTKLHVNGSIREIDSDPSWSLLSVLRDQLDLTGTKYGCGEGACGACTVLIDGNWQRSCITRVETVAQKVASSRARDTERGTRVIPDYADVHPQTERDEVVLQTRQRAGRVRAEVMALLGALSNHLPGMRCPGFNPAKI